MTKVIGDITENDLLAALSERYGYEKRQPGDVDKFMLAASSGLSEATAARILKQEAKAGRLIEVKILQDNGHPLAVYRKA